MTPIFENTRNQCNLWSRRQASILLCLAVLGLPAAHGQPLTPAVTQERPNILIIVADDLGFSDLGCYGADVIETGCLNRLAKEGMRFTQFYSAGRGCPTRASLLTGLYAHQTDVGHTMLDFKVPGYRGNLNRDCATIAEILGAAGYQTLMAGKWHLSRHVNRRGPMHTWPLQRGFDEFFGTILGAGSYFQPATLARGNVFMGAEETADFYYTEAIGKQAVALLDRAETDEAPFFLYVAFTAPHWPLHARQVLLDAYRGKFHMGWDELRLRRHRRQIDMKIVHRYWKLTPRDPRVLSWFEAPYKDWHQRRMEAYAAQVQSMDQAVGKILEKVKQLGREQNTLVLFLSDNGAGAEEILADWTGLHIPEKTSKGVAVRVGNDPQATPGAEETYQSYGVPWANVSNTPFRSYKGSCYEGGIAVPLIVRWPAVIQPGQATGDITREIAHVIDVAATCYDVAGVPYPAIHAGYRIDPLEGESLLPVLLKQERKPRPLFFEHEGNRAVRFGMWKLVAAAGGPWELYDMNADRTETADLAAKKSEILAKMVELYEKWSERIGVQPWQTGG